MFIALIATPVVPLALAFALGEPEAAMLGAGVTGGAGVYVQPGVDVTHAAATRPTSVRIHSRGA